jgi:hypothetical protein
MRFVLTAGACLAAASIATAASAGDGDCHAEGRSEHGGFVSVRFRVEDAKVRYATVDWSPPLAQPENGGRSPRLEIGYRDASASGPGRPYRVSASVLVIGKAPAFDGASVSLSAGEGRWRAPFRMFGMIAADPQADSMISGDAVLADPPLLAAVDAPGSVQVTVEDRDGRALAGYVYDLTGRAERDALFAKAWAEADAWAKSERLCD